MASGQKPFLALALLAVAATVFFPTCARAATAAGSLSSYALATIRGVAGHWVATIDGACVEAILTPQGRLTQRYHEGGSCSTPVSRDINSSVVAASCLDIDSVPVPRLYKLIFEYDLDPNVLGCFLLGRRPGGILSQVVPPNGRNTAFACPSVLPSPTAPAPAIILNYAEPVVNIFTGLTGTLAVPGDEALACGNMVTGTPFTGPYLPFADDFSGAKRNIPNKELWDLSATTISGARRGGPRPQTRQGIKVRDNSAEAHEKGFLVHGGVYLQTRPLVVGPGAAVKINKMIMPYNPAKYDTYNAVLTARLPAVPDVTVFNVPRFNLLVTSTNGPDGWYTGPIGAATWNLNVDWSNQTSFTFPMPASRVQGVSIVTVRLEFVGLPPAESDMLEEMWFKGVEITNVMWIGVDDNLDALRATTGIPGTVFPTIPVSPKPFYRGNRTAYYSLGTDGFETGTLDSSIWSPSKSFGNIAVVTAAVGGIKPYKGNYMLALGKEGSANFTVLESGTLRLNYYSAMTMYMAVTSSTGLNCTPFDDLDSGLQNIVNIQYRTEANPTWRSTLVPLDPGVRAGGWAKMYLDGNVFKLPANTTTYQLQFSIDWVPSPQCPSVLLVDEIRFYNVAAELDLVAPPPPPPTPAPKSRRTRSPPPPPVRHPRKDPNKRPKRKQHGRYLL